MAYDRNNNNSEKKYEISNEKFVNPYHFIPLEDGCIRKTSIDISKENDLLTGWIECSLTTLTPTFIPNTNNDNFYKVKDNKKNQVKSYDFFSYLNNSKNLQETASPIILGSSIRGTIRSVFEAVTNSCLSTTDDNFVLYKRTSTSGKLGKLKKNGDRWYIQPCERYAVSHTYNRQDPNNFMSIINTLTEGQKIYFKKGINYQKQKRNSSMAIFTCVSELSIESKKGNGWLEGYFHHGEAFGRRKHHESIFFETNQHEIPISKRDVESLLENYRLYQEKTVNLHYKQNQHKGYMKAFPNAKRAHESDLENALIYYAEHDGNYYLSPAAIGREVFQNRLKDLLDKYPQGGYSPCSKKDQLCPACALFGFVSKDEQLASRIRFSDAKPQNFNFLPAVIIPELSGPKVSATEMYFEKLGRSQLWNADYTIPSNPKYTAKIMGRKFYWHSDPTSILKEDVKDFSNRNSKIRPLDKESKFTFKIHYNNITKLELKQILWTLTLGDNPNLAHKIGMGKPLGLGSVKFNIDKLVKRELSLDNNDFYRLIEWDEEYRDYKNSINKKTLEAMEILFNFKNKQTNVRYPYAIGKNGYELAENYHWFVGNKQIDKNARGTKPIIDMNLEPLSKNNDPSLNVIINNHVNGDESIGKSYTKETKKEEVIVKRQEKDPNLLEMEALKENKDIDEFFVKYANLKDKITDEKYKKDFEKLVDNQITIVKNLIQSEKKEQNIETLLDKLLKYKNHISKQQAVEIASTVKKKGIAAKNSYSPLPKYVKAYHKFCQEFNLIDN